MTTDENLSACIERSSGKGRVRDSGKSRGKNTNNVLENSVLKGTVIEDIAIITAYSLTCILARR